jgi:polyisoprenoid-binding protein YceI
VLTQPITLDSIPIEGVPVTVTAVGNLTLHGVTRPISIQLQGQRINGYVVVVGSTDIRFADYGIAQPRSFNVLSVQDHGTLELQLVFQKAAPQS